MTNEQIEMSMFLSGPMADGLDAVEEALTLCRSSSGETKKRAQRILAALKLAFKDLAPRTTSAARWEELENQIVRALP